MLWVGLTGGIASGKSTVARLLAESGVPVVSADELAHGVLAQGQEGYAPVLEAFGREILDSKERIDRKKLGSFVFSDTKKRERLEAIVHPLIREMALKRKAELAAQGCSVAVYEVPLLFEKNLRDLFDYVVVVSAPETLQKERMRTRDGLSDKEIEGRLRAQLPMGEKVARSDFNIVNTKDISSLHVAVEDLLSRLRALPSPGVTKNKKG